jgi:galactoside O-acetyltransferase
MDFKSCGDNVKIFNPTTLIEPSKFTIGSDVIISEYCHIYGGLGVSIGDFVHISANVCVGGGGKLTVGSFVNISAGAHLITGTDSVMGEGLVGAACPLKFRQVNRSFIILEDYSWVGTNATVLPGITIGEGAVVGAGSVVTKDIEPWTIVVGNPARPVRIRPKDKIINLSKELLLKN